MESNKIVKSSAHLKSSELVESSMIIMMMMNDGDDDDDARPLSCRLSESIKLLTHIAAEMKTPRCGMPESIELYRSAQHQRPENAQCQNLQNC